MDTGHATAIALLITGVLVVLANVVKVGLERLRVPALVGYILLGLLVRVLDEQTGALSGHGRELLHFLGKLGVIALLFRVGLESNVSGLLRQLRSASVIWIGSVGVAGALGYWAAQLWLDLGVVPSLVIGVAMTATSVGIPTLVWRDLGALDTRQGERFLDVAEMDDISGVALLALLFSVLPLLLETTRDAADAAGIMGTLLQQTGLFSLKLAALGVGAWVFSRWLEAPFIRSICRLESAPDPMLVVAGTGIAFAAVTALLGFSVAIGAFIAGLAFSRDPRADQVLNSFRPLYELLTPFFFVSAGLMLAPSALAAAAGSGAVLLSAAVVGKFLGTALPARAYGRTRDAVVLGVSMIPRAEITMLIVQKAHAAGPDVLGRTAYASMVMVCAVTCLIGPLVLRWLLDRPGVVDTP